MMMMMMMHITGLIFEWYFNCAISGQIPQRQCRQLLQNIYTFPRVTRFPYTVAERFCFDQLRSSIIFAGLVPYVAVPLIQYISFVDPFINVTNPLHCQLQQQASDRHPRRHGEEMSTRLFESDRFTVQCEFACWMVLVEPLKIHMYWL